MQKQLSCTSRPSECPVDVYLGKNAYFIYEKDIEYLLAAIELLCEYGKNPKIREVYTEEFLKQQQERYPLLFEVFRNLHKNYGVELFEFLLDFNLSDFSLESYFAHIRSLSKKEILSRFLQQPIEMIEQGLDSESGQIAIYQKNKTEFYSFFVVEVLFQRTEWFLNTLESFVCTLRTKEADAYLTQYAREIETWKQKMIESLEKEEPLEYSESLMGKTFHNRGPFDKFYFMPSIFMPMKCCRWFEEYQILMFDAISFGQQDNRMIADALKMLSDKTRYQILVLLKEKKSMNGIEIAEQMKLAPSTVSHHMTHLKNSGLVHEEPAGNTKYYSINTHCMKNCIETLEKTFL